LLLIFRPHDKIQLYILKQCEFNELFTFTVFPNSR